MSMKTIVSDDLKVRLNYASINGSVIATDILEQLKLNKDVSEVIRGTSNYFQTKRVKNSAEEYIKMKVIFTACTKDLSNENFPDKQNPKAPWFAENRTKLEPSTFVGYFKELREYTDEELEYFANAICVSSKVEIKMYDKMNDFIDAYIGDNYIPFAQYGENSTLHNSCMRHANLVYRLGDFYSNFAGASILVARDSENNVLGRAIVWKKAIGTFNGEVKEMSVLDRVYYSHSFVMKMIIQYAQANGINLRKTINDYSHRTQFTVMNSVEGLNMQVGDKQEYILDICVPASKWHKKGTPYLDTFCYVNITEDGKVQLGNQATENCVATCQQTGGTASQSRYICPSCGKVHNCGEDLCDTCRQRLTVNTIFGKMLMDKVKTYNDVKYPASFFEKGRPSAHLELNLQIAKLY
nr:MAG TPA: adenylate kinase [Caudoviricetes sp.]